MARGGREHMWAVLDALDARPALKKILLIGVPALAIAVGFGVWGYQRWTQNNAVRIGRQWLDADRLDRAGIAIQEALTTEPGMPEPWRLASELAWRKGNGAASAEYAKKAAVVGGYQAGDVLAWAEAAILSDDVEQAKEAWTYLDATKAQESSRALRLAGEIARRGQNFTESRDRFQAALVLDTGAGVPSLAVDEVPLGIVCLQTGLESDRTRGQALLARWAPDPNWGVEALRPLLADAAAHRDRVGETRWADELRKHPRCTLGDMPVCLKALAESDPARYKEMLSPLEDKSRTNPYQAAQLLGWLTQIGQSAEAVRWGESLDPAAARKPPIAVGVAEALRSLGRWADLKAWADNADWGRDLDFIGLAFRMAAARQLGDGPAADSAWRGVYTDGGLSPAHALYLGDSLYAWGYPKEAAELLWEAADRPDLAYQAVGTLARLYQMQRDAVGQYRAFSRLEEMRPSDRRISNNFAYYAALTDLGSQTQVLHIAEGNFASEPANAVYRSTYAFVLVWAGQGSQALALMEPVSREWRTSHAVAFAYGAALASVGRKSEAREMFDSLNPQELDAKAIDWILAALR